MLERQHLDGSADPDAASNLRHGAGKGEGRSADAVLARDLRDVWNRREVMLREPHRVEAELIRRAHLVQMLGDDLRLGLPEWPLHQMEGAELHSCQDLTPVLLRISTPS